MRIFECGKEGKKKDHEKRGKYETRGYIYRTKISYGAYISKGGNNKSKKAEQERKWG